VASVAGWGIEIEGGWDAPPVVDGQTVDIVHDGSVAVRSNFTGEVRSPVKTDWSEMVKWTLEAYPGNANSSCGIHVHMSVASAGLYSRLMDVHFAAHVRRALRKWGAAVEANNAKEREDMANFAKRIAGENRYCRRVWLPDEQVRGQGESRYGFLNFCYGKHKTVELRVLPTFTTKRLAEGAVSAYCKAASDWVEKLPSRSGASDGLRVVVKPDSPVASVIVSGDRVRLPFGATAWVLKVSRRAPSMHMFALCCIPDGTYDWYRLVALERLEPEKPPPPVVERFHSVDNYPAYAEMYMPEKKGTEFRQWGIYAISRAPIEAQGHELHSRGPVLAICCDVSGYVFRILCRDGHTEYGLGEMEDVRLATPEDVTSELVASLAHGFYRSLNAEGLNSLVSLVGGSTGEED
jgi:hypothetical protein